MPDTRDPNTTQNTTPNTPTGETTTTVTLPGDVAKELQAEAERFGMDLATYLAFVARVHVHHHDEAFVDAVRFAFKNYPDTLRKLAQ